MNRSSWDYWAGLRLASGIYFRALTILSQYSMSTSSPEMITFSEGVGLINASACSAFCSIPGFYKTVSDFDVALASCEPTFLVIKLDFKGDFEPFFSRFNGDDFFCCKELIMGLESEWSLTCERLALTFGASSRVLRLLLTLLTPRCASCAPFCICLS